MHSPYHKEYSAKDLYYVLIGAVHYLESTGMNLQSNEVNKNPRELEDMYSLIAIALAEHRAGNNETTGYAKNVKGARNSNGTYDHGLWQINMNDSIYTYLTSQQGKDGTNANIPMFIGLSKEQMINQMYDPFANAVAAIAISQLTVGPENTQGINNWSTVGMIDTSKAFYQEAKKDLENHLAALEFEKDMMDRKIQESYNIDLSGIGPTVNPDTVDVTEFDEKAKVIWGRSDYSNLNLVDKFMVKNVVEPAVETYQIVKPMFKEAFNNFRDSVTENPIDKQQEFNRQVYGK